MGVYEGIGFTYATEDFVHARARCEPEQWRQLFQYQVCAIQHATEDELFAKLVSPLLPHMPANAPCTIDSASLTILAIKFTEVEHAQLIAFVEVLSLGHCDLTR